MFELLMFTFFILVFLTGMYILRAGLFNLTGEKLKSFLTKITNKPWKGFITGILFTGLLQSSSAVMVMTIGFVSAGSLSFPQTIGIILGTNIGSTFITEFITFSLNSLIMPLALIGAIILLIPRAWAKNIGIALIGTSAIFTAMNGFKMLAAPISAFPLTRSLLVIMENHLIFAVLTGMLITAIIHSSSATIGIAMGFLAGGDLTVPTAIVIMLGSNIGTCITGWMASIGSRKEAAFTAYAHIWLNVIGVIAFLPFTDLLADFVASLTSSKEIQLAHASLLFNIITSLAVLPFSRQFAGFVLWMHKKAI